MSEAPTECPAKNSSEKFIAQLGAEVFLARRRRNRVTEERVSL